MTEKVLLAYLRYNALCAEAYRLRLHQHPEMREVESKHFREFMQTVRQQKLNEIN